MKRFIFWMLLPTFSIVAVLTYYPTIKGVFLAFEDYTVFNFQNIQFVGWQNFENIFMDPNFFIALWNTVWWIAFSVALQFVLGFALALLMKEPFKGRGIYAGIVFYPWALSGFALGILWSWLLNGQFGLINDILIKLHLIQHGINFLSNPFYAFISVIAVNVWYGVPFFAIMILAALQSIPNSLYEAAEIDGAGAISKFFNVTLPYIKPTVVSTLLLRVIWVMNFPDIIYGMTRGGPAGATNILATYMINIVYYETDYSKASAVGLIIVSVLMIYALIYLKFTSTYELGEI
ncbi:carbohydrate ABC transporter permease [Mesoaciditoga lauensis]|uniref:carbohydrate ABC transporter permease n=1 Tax=Mesoaciditoga lauensis TaxID=1495039 RepID=UPI001B801B48|nr:sugar ABC transporter permease [Mesoaciditoga lauensis]